MPLVNESNPFNNAPKDPNYKSTIFEKDYKHSIVNSEQTPIDSLLTHISGMNWVVDYYSQVLGDDEAPNDFSPSDTSTYRQYEVIHRYELKLQSDLSVSFDNAQNRANVTGIALTYPKLVIPNKGDVIIGDIGDGRAGRFTVTSVNQRSIYLNTTYEIEFELQAIHDGDAQEVLTNRVIKTTHFDKDFLLYGQNPILVDTDFQMAKKLRSKIEEVLGDWVSEFYSHEISTIKIPLAGGHCFDPFLTSAMVKVFGADDHRLLSRVSMYNCDEMRLESYTDIWTAIIEGKSWLLRSAFKEFQLVPTRMFSNNIYLRSVRYSGIDYVLVPLIYSDSVNDPLDVLKYSSGYNFRSDGDIPDSPESNSLLDTNQYIFSEDIYELTATEQSGISQQFMNYFQEDAVEINEVLTYLDNKDKLTPLQRFYFMPICLFMMIHVLRSI